MRQGEHVRSENNYTWSIYCLISPSVLLRHSLKMFVFFVIMHVANPISTIDGGNMRRKEERKQERFRKG